MKFALVNGERREAEPSLMGECLGCGNPVVAKCGEVRIKHWAHKARARCDAWWETETEWHRAWKNQFPSEWQEVIHYAENGEKHIADVKTDQGWVIEFQHSHIKPDERGSREDFYGKLIWVVDGNRRVRDQKKFFEVLRDGGGRLFDSKKYHELRPISWPEGALFRDWIASRSHVFFDFGEDELWWLLPQSNEHGAFVRSIARQELIGFHSKGHPTGAGGFEALIEKYDVKPPDPIKTNPHPVSPTDIHPNYLLMRLRNTRRFRL